jgi:hypothetical protein
MKSLVLLFSLFFSFSLLAQQDLYYAMPVGQDLNVSNDLNYGQKVKVNLEDWANSKMDWIMVENGSNNLEMNKAFLLPFAPPNRNSSMAEYALNEQILDFTFESEIAGDWKENKTLSFPGALNSGQLFTIMKSLFEKPLRSLEELPAESINYSNYNLGEVYMADVIKMEDYEHYVFYLNSSSEWFHSIQLIKGGYDGSKIIRTRYRVSTPQLIDPSSYFVINDDTPFYTNSMLNTSKAGTLKTNDELFLTHTQLLTSNSRNEKIGEYHLKNGKKVCVSDYQVLNVPAPVRSKSIKEYVGVLHQLGLKTDYYSKQWIQDQKVYTNESFVLPTSNFASAVLVMGKIFPTVEDHLAILPNGLIIKKTEDVNMWYKENGDLLQISIKDVDSEKSIGLLLDEQGLIKIVTQKI